MKKILFLDFDGVLHPSSAYTTHPFVHALALANCLNPYNCQVVISSSWRFQYTTHELLNMLPSALAERVTGFTGSVHIGRFARYHEIRNYLIRHVSPEGVSWRVLDDSNWEFPPGTSELITCDPNHGIDSGQLRELESWLRA